MPPEANPAPRGTAGPSREKAFEYDAFISYGHATDGDLAGAVRDGLERLAKPWNQRRALRVFRDTSSLAATPRLWATIELALDSSRYLVLLASPSSAQSEWVNREIERFVDLGRVDRILIVLTAGELRWDDGERRFDSLASTALPAALVAAFADEPLHVDVRAARDPTTSTLRHPEFRARIADLAATIHGVDRDEIDAADLREFRRSRMVRRIATSALAVLAAVATVAGIVAVTNAREARRQQRSAEFNADVADQQRAVAESNAAVADARRLAAVSTARAASETDLALLLALESLAVEPTVEGRTALVAAMTQTVVTRAAVVAHDARPEFGDDGPQWGVAAVALAPDGRTAASGGADGRVRMWDTATREPIGGSDARHGGIVWDLSFSEDGRVVYSTSDDATVRLWDAASGEPIGSPYVLPASGRAVATDPRGGLVAIGWHSPELGGWVTVLDEAARELTTWPAHSGVTWDLDFSEDGSTLAVGAFSFEDGGIVSLRDPLTGQSVAPLLGRGLRTAPVLSYDDGPFAASVVVGEYDGTVTRWWPDQDFGPSSIARHDGSVAAVAVSDDSYVVASVGADGMLRLSNTENLTPIGPPVPAPNAAALALGPDAEVVVWGGDDGQLRFWELRDTQLRGHVGANAAGVVDAAYRPSGDLLATGDLGEIRLWDTATREEVLPRPTGGFDGALEFGPDGRLLAFSSTDAIRLWDVERGRVVDDLRFEGSGGFDDVGFSPDGHLFAAARGERLRVWTTGDWRAFAGDLDSTDGIAALAFSPDGTLLVTGDRKGLVTTWGTSTWERVDEVRLPDALAVKDLAVAPDGSKIAAATTGGVHQLTVDGLDVIGRSMAGRMDAIVYGPDSTLLASVGDALTVWDAETGERIGVDRAGTRAIAISPDGRQLAVGSRGPDGAVRLWPGLSGLEELACDVAARNLTTIEWSDLGPTAIQYRTTCPGHP